MNNEKWLGKISRCTFGCGGYDDAMFGVSFTFSGTYGCSDFWGSWKTRPESAKWTDEDWNKNMADVCRRLMKVMGEAKVSDIRDLVGIPVEVTSMDNRLSSWRILTEVL